MEVPRPVETTFIDAKNRKKFLFLFFYLLKLYYTNVVFFDLQDFQEPKL